MLTQQSEITGLTKTIQHRQLDHAVRDIANLIEEVNNIGSGINQHIGNSNFVIDDPKRTLTLSGPAAVNTFSILNSSGTTEILKIYGDDRIGFLDEYIFPSTDGTVGQALTTDGVGQLGWSTIVDTNTNLGSNDQIVADTTRTVTLSGILSSNYLLFENSSNNKLMQVQGDHNTYFYNSAGTGTVRVASNSAGVTMFTQGVDVGGTGTAFQYNTVIRGGAGANTGIIDVKNSSGVRIFDFRQSGGSATLALNNSAGAQQIFLNTGNGITLTDSMNLIVGTGAGSKLGTSTSQKIGIWNATPIVQPTTAHAAAVFVANTSGIVDDTATWDGYTLGQVVKAMRDFGFLA